MLTNKIFSKVKNFVVTAATKIDVEFAVMRGIFFVTAAANFCGNKWIFSKLEILSVTASQQTSRVKGISKKSFSMLF